MVTNHLVSLLIERLEKFFAFSVHWVPVPQLFFILIEDVCMWYSCDLILLRQPLNILLCIQRNIKCLHLLDLLHKLLHLVFYFIWNRDHKYFRILCSHFRYVRKCSAAWRTPASKLLYHEWHSFLELCLLIYVFQST